ncbi:6-phosphogluconate dehydrogenase C-terminal domain-like protein [Aaosphaeria arxii CBS 175.79]|uniref:6-phosphogluconate dehydrogenase C-terminal domain-like protein n=1 Tax=Aaosphaeria arxii CBS 175.79 TaxID=1450172 RepID=A0A6A5YAM2_9PLEO|nr:6-phosphogluconate dehydrogenase C-terminal domain-like protein [Aaosphaeria arxii CBS 175.79]KAF2022273.1 6-phosphogluconate dehydrogenase C-terminal domain-like protein [Aaosphaeria arxii CBS 175.79]
MSSPLATVGVLSIGQMGLGVAKLLVAHNYHVITNVSDRSSATQARAHDAQLGLVQSDTELVQQSDYILSIVPPRDAVETARRILFAYETTNKPTTTQPLYYLDLNAISPSTATSIADQFAQKAPGIRFIDGGVIGAPPSPSSSSSSSSTWIRPGIPLSGPHPLYTAEKSGSHLAEVLNSRHLGPKIGSASGVKCCFAAISKGLTALMLQSFTTANALGVLPALHDYLKEYNPAAAQRVDKSVVGCAPKAYRWVEEMNQIGDCFAEDGGWQQQAKVFREIAQVYEGLAGLVERRGGVDGFEDAVSVADALSRDLDDKEA